VLGSSGQEANLQPQLSLIIPAFNEAGCIAESLTLVAESLTGGFGNFEVIVVDDGSTDETARLAKEHPLRPQVVRLGKNLGKGAAVRRGVAEARGDYIFFTDADIPYDLSFLNEAVTYLKDNRFDIVLGARDLSKPPNTPNRKLLRRLASDVFTLFINRVVVRGIPDTQCGIKGFTRRAATELFPILTVDRFAFDVELVYLARKLGHRIKRLPVSQRPERKRSSVSVMRDSPVMLWDVLNVMLNFHRGKYTRR